MICGLFFVFFVEEIEMQDELLTTLQGTTITWYDGGSEEGRQVTGIYAL